MPSIKSPWANAFDMFVNSIQESAIIATPFVTRYPIERLTEQLHSRRSIQIDFLTSLDENSLVDGSVDITALSWLCKRVPQTRVRHLRYLHAKAYIADNHTAIVTSANLTSGGLWRNYELGVEITDPREVGEIAADLQEYGSFGVAITPDSLDELGDLARQARQHKQISDANLLDYATAEHDEILAKISDRLAELRTDTEEFVVDPRASTTAKFADAVKYILRRNGPLPTAQINPLVQELIPEWCDDNVDRVIRGVSFGRKWKHQVRNAQVKLRREGVIVLDGRVWKLI